MSSKSKKTMSDHEAQILERQRQVAAKLAASKPPPEPAPAKPKASKRPSQLKSSKPTVSIQQTIQKQKLEAMFKSDGKPAATTAKIKRPTLRNKPPPPPTTAAAALAAARNRIATTKSKNSFAPTKPVVDLTQKPAAIPSKKEAPSVVAKSSSKLAQLVSASAKTYAAGTSSTTSSFGMVEPDDFWRNMRDWDFLRQLYKEKSSQKNPSTRGTEPNEPSSAATKPLPDTFVSHRHYVSAWAPLCLNEARAQLMSEFMSDINYWNKPGNGPIQVKVKSLQRDVGSMLDSISVQVFSNDNKREPSFFANDLVLLVTKDYILKNSIGGKEDDYRKCALVGHTEYARKSLDGLTLKVSKRWWVQVGKEDMILIKIGCNITALREFTALCRVESIPLRRYLLGQDLAEEAASTKKQPATNGEQTDKKDKARMLHHMGGVSALGKGFTEYAQKKFNQSQLGAISAAASEYGDGGFTLIKGPPGTGKTTTLVALMNSLHIRQFNKYYEEVRKIATDVHVGNRKTALGNAAKAKPRLLVCAPSNAAVDNIILKIMENGFIDGNGCRYNPSIVRVGVGQSAAVKDVALEAKVDAVLENNDIAQLDSSIAGYKMEIQKIQSDIARLRKRVHALSKASPWPLSKNWEIRIDEDNFEQSGRVYFVNHKEKSTSFEVPLPPEPGEKQFPATAMPEYRSYLGKIVKLVERYNSITAKIERCTIVQGSVKEGRGGHKAFAMRQQLETQILDSVHVVMTTLGTAGNRVLESAAKFEVVVVDEAAQSVEPATLSALQLGSSHAILVGDPQQLPATIFSVSGRNTKYDRSLFQRLEEAGHEVHLLNTQYRMHPAISHFPRHIFYGGNLLDGPNVTHPEYGNPLRKTVLTKLPTFQPFMVLDLDSKEERGGTSLANSAEAHLAVHLYESLKRVTGGLSAQSRVAVVTPYAQQANLLRRTFSEHLGPDFASRVEVNTVDAFQGREANIVIFSCVRAAGSRGIGFLSDVRRMNVALTRAKHFLFVIARCKSIVVNPYWRDLVNHARETKSVVKVHMNPGSRGDSKPSFPNIEMLEVEKPPRKAIVPAKRKLSDVASDEAEDGEV